MRLWRHDARVLGSARITYRVTLLLGALSLVYGYLALQAAQRSAAAGGGLLGGFGVIPLVSGGILVLIALFSLRAVTALAAASGPAQGKGIVTGE